MTTTYHSFRADDNSEYGSFKVFYWSEAEAKAFGESGAYGITEGDELLLEAGWFWQFGFPGCLPTSDAFGPFETEADALAAALG